MPGPHVEGKRSFTGKLRAAYVRPYMVVTRWGCHFPLLIHSA